MELPPERQSEAGVWARALKAEEKLRRFTTVEGGRVGSWHPPRSLLVARCYAEVRQGRVPVRVANLEECGVTLGARTKSRELYLVERVPEQEVDVSISPHTQTEAYIRVVSAEPASSKSATEGSDEPLPVDVDVDALTDEQKTKLRDFLLKHKDTFSADKHDFGHTSAVTNRIFTGDAPPSREPYRRIPPTMYKEVKDHIQVMLDKGVIQPSCIPWAALVVLVRKKDGGLRFCIDYRKLNARTHRDASPLPRIEESLDALGGAQLFSTLDLALGYWQVEVHPDDREKTAFTSVHGLFKFVRLPLGLSGAPATLSRLIQSFLGDQNLETLLIYLDDIIVFSKSFEEHLDRLDLVFSRLRQYGLKLRPDKCHLFRTSVKYLGHVVSADGVATDSDKTAALRDWPVPTTAKQVRQFLGIASYYRRFVESFGKIAGPLHELTRKDSPFRWTPECQIAFDTLRKANANADALSRLPLRETHVSVLAAYAQASGTLRRKKVVKPKGEDDTVGVALVIVERKSVVLPTSLRREVLGALHNRNGHMGIPKTLKMVKQRFFWPGMQDDVTAWVKTPEAPLLPDSDPRPRREARPSDPEQNSDPEAETATVDNSDEEDIAEMWPETPPIGETSSRGPVGALMLTGGRVPHRLPSECFPA
ncbi:hypothetical protein Bbelb_381790 [Branchiostoma belcheri]|nr:hypothetical protein Bbelb_381790 [Branchiostoma belcheri]